MSTAQTSAEGTRSFFAVVKKISVYTVSVGVEALIAAALLPILSSNLTPSEYGVWVLFSALFAFSRPLVGLMMEDTLRINYYKLDDKEFLNSFRTIVSLSLFIFGALLILIYPLQSFITDIFQFPGEYYWAFLLAASLHSVYYSILAVSQFRGDSGFYFRQQILQVILAISFTAIFVSLGYSWLGAALARILALCVCNIVGLKWVSKCYGGFSNTFLDLESIKKLAKLGAKFVPMGLSIVVIPLTDRVVVSTWEGHQETGYFGIAALFCSVINIANKGFITTLQPVLFKNIQKEDGDDNQILRLINRIFFTVIPILAILIVLASYLVLPFMVSYSTEEITKYLIVLAAATCAGGFYQHAYNPLHAAGKFRMLVLSSSTVIIANLALTIILVQKLGGIGVAWGTFIAYFGVFLVLLAYNKSSKN